ncbi:bifunctional riboflavin kinase/FAD synthetase [Helicobacter salomonis]|uniref:bifunctional riboflavin kinase/FAD synthetase n=1 Tax=Helicobacter salomonis TaxID=56878 RepID=UPI000CF174A2|nr:bifunctional riboflavin kinase/FAD synthetase [Helicobacter salomonis]
MQKFLSISKDETSLSLAIGKFDGVHLAHQHLLSALGSQGAVLVVERTHPLMALSPLEERAHLLERYARHIYFLPLEEARGISASEFIALLEAKFPNLQKIVVGYDFKCAQGRSMGVEQMRALLPPKIQLQVMEAIKIKGIALHSYHIKECIQRGDVRLAHQFLGRPFSLQGHIIADQNLGSSHLYPTLNLNTQALQTELLPHPGVYITNVPLAKQCSRAVSFLGHRLSTDGKMAFETYILDRHIQIPPSVLRVCFLKKIRDNRHFGDLADLKAQISQDIALARTLD